MTQEEAKAWKSAVDNSKFQWKIDKIHNSPTDLLCYQGASIGQFAHIHRIDNGFRLDLGTYIGANSSIGDAAFTVMGKRTFSNFPEVMEYIQDRVGIVLTKA